MVDWKLYLELICEKYAQWWDTYTLTNVVGNKYDQKVRKSLLLDLQAIALKPETVKPEREQFLEAREEREVFNVLEGLRKYAPEHVLLSGRPGSGKSTALVRLLLEEAEKTSPQTPLRSGEGLNIAPPSRVGKGVGGLGQIPVLVELRYYETSILDLITAFLHRHDPSLTIDCETIKTLLRQGQFLLLIDGVNELPSQEAQRNLQKFRQDYQQTTPMVFTTRDLGVGGDLGISKKLEMQPLTETQMGDFVRGYLPETGEQMLQQLGGRLREFGETPLLLMMLCSVFASNENQIPPNLGSVFRRFTEIYDGQLKQDIPVTDESRRWWKRLLQHLAWVMMGGCRDAIYRVSTPTEFLVAIPQQQAEEIFTEYLEGKVNCAADCAISWLNDLLKHHLIQIGAENKIEFRHQLIQEYYAAERFLQEIGKLSDDELQWDYLNYLKWTEPAALMLGLLDDEGLALRVIRLALQVDWQLGARLGGEVKFEWQEKTVGLVEGLVKRLNFPPLLRISLLEKIKSEAAIPGLIKLLEDSDVRRRATSALGEIKSEAAIIQLIQLVEDKDEDIAVRNSAASGLGKIKSEVAITRLIQLLGHKDLYVRDSAASALAEIQSESVITRLTKLLNDEDLYVRRSAVYALGEIKSEAAIIQLIKFLDYEEDLYVRKITASALGKIKSEAAIIQLIRFLEDEDSGVRNNAALALSQGEIKSEVAITQLIQLLEHKNLDVSKCAVDALKKIKSEVAVTQLIQLLEYDNSDIRKSAAYALGQIKSKAAITRLIQLLENEDSSICDSAVYALVEIKSEPVITELIKFVNHSKNSDARGAAAYIMGEIKLESAIPSLTQLLNDEDAFISYHAASALIKIKSEEAIPGLIKILEDEHSSLYYDAIDALVEIKSEIAITKLIKLLEHKSFDVRRYVALALSDIDSDSVISGLIKLLDNENSLLRLLATYALYTVNSEEAIPRLIKFLEDENYDTRNYAAQTLGKIKSADAIPSLIKLLDDEDSNVHNSAIFALGEMRSEAAIPGLIRIIENANENRRSDWSHSEILDRAIPILIEIKSELVVSGLIQLLEQKNYLVHKSAARTLGKIKSEAAVPKLIKLLEHEDFNIRWSVASALQEIKSEVTMINLLDIFNNQTFLQANNGEYTLDAIEILEKIQEHLKYYKPEPQRNMNPSNNYALLIGVGECAYSDWSLPVTVKDIQALKTILIDPNLCGYIDNNQHLRLIHDKTATSQNILDGLSWLKQQAENDPEATIFIYYSGHGWLDKSTNKYYLIPHEIKPHKLTKTALPAETFNATLQQIPAKQLLVIIDSCHAQGMASSKDEPEESELPDNFVETALPKNIIDELKQGMGRAVFTSSTGNQKSWIRPDGEMSVFTYHLLEALRGKGNQRGDKVVRVSHLMNYLGETIPESARDLCKAEQTPFFDFATEDFPVALLHGGKGLASTINVPQPKSKIELDSATIQELMEILQPFMQITNNRQSFLFSALGNRLPILQHIDFSGSVASFIPYMVDKLADYGKLPLSGKQALWELLEYTRSQVGSDIQQRINKLEIKINI